MAATKLDRRIAVRLAARTGAGVGGSGLANAVSDEANEDATEEDSLIGRVSKVRKGYVSMDFPLYRVQATRCGPSGAVLTRVLAGLPFRLLVASCAHSSTGPLFSYLSLSCSYS